MGPGAPRERAGQSQHGRRQRAFCALLADWPGNAVPIEWLVDLLELVRTTPHLEWLMLTKRIGIVLERSCCRSGSSTGPKTKTRSPTCGWAPPSPTSLRPTAISRNCSLCLRTYAS
ncbi:DUF5131 family protein [Delftia acidovorans]|uniref:DUF5131 family protein n=1 Tax=Delftia acidovorans TaxID=80866 RepID=UPI000C782F98|nr:DUF5131 family protein [Delftia acidovorans]